MVIAYAGWARVPGERHPTEGDVIVWAEYYTPTARFRATILPFPDLSTGTVPPPRGSRLPGMGATKGGRWGEAKR